MAYTSTPDHLQSAVRGLLHHCPERPVTIIDVLVTGASGYSRLNEEALGLLRQFWRIAARL